MGLLQAFGAAIAAAAKTHKAKTAAAAVAGAEKLDSAAIEKIAIGALTGAYEAVRFKNKATLSPLETVDILAGENTDSAAAVDRAAAFARGVTLAKYVFYPCQTVPSHSHLLSNFRPCKEWGWTCCLRPSCITTEYSEIGCGAWQVPGGGAPKYLHPHPHCQSGPGHCRQCPRCHEGIKLLLRMNSTKEA